MSLPKLVSPPPPVADRLRTLMAAARQMGFAIRMEPLGGDGTDWCEIGGRVHLFVDLQQSCGGQERAVQGIMSSLGRG